MLFLMFLVQVDEQVGGGGGEQVGHSGTLHSGEQMLFLMFLRQVLEHVGVLGLGRLAGWDRMPRPDSGVGW